MQTPDIRIPRLHLSTKNLLSVVIGVCLVGLAVIPIKVPPEQWAWLRWQILVYALAAFGVAAIFIQSLIQSKEDHERKKQDSERDAREVERDIKLQDMAAILEQLKTGNPKASITETTVKLEEATPSPPPSPPPDIDGEVYRLVYSPRSAAWEIVRDAFKLQGKQELATVDTDILVDMYLVNQNLQNPQYLKDISLSAEVAGKRIVFRRQGDFMADTFGNRRFEYGLKNPDNDEVEPLKPLIASWPATLQPQQPADGWVRFMADVNPEQIANGSIVITVTNSVGKEYTISKVNNDKPRLGEIELRRVS